MRSEPVVLTAPAKINLFLHITGRLENGYHELDTLFFALDAPHDTLTFSPGEPGTGCTLACDIEGLSPEHNLAHKAHRAFAEATGHEPDLHIHIHKRIPQGAGLGGGSTDAATVLRYMNDRAGDKALPLDKLIALAATLGADVPFFLLDTPARATGIGDKLVPQDVDFTGLTLVVACPEEHVNTAWAYGAWDQALDSAREAVADSGNTTASKDNPPALTSGPSHNTRATPQALPTLHNDFESVVFQAFPAIRAVKELLLQGGAAGAAMSGSGASVFALFRNADEAKNTARNLAARGVRAYTRRY